MQKPFFKKPYERYPISCDFVNCLPPSAPAITSATVAAHDDLGVDASSAILESTAAVISDTRAVFWVEGGTDGKRYHIELVVNFADGSVLQENFIMMIRENY